MYSNRTMRGYKKDDNVCYYEKGMLFRLFSNFLAADYTTSVALHSKTGNHSILKSIGVRLSKCERIIIVTGAGMI